MLTQSYSGRKGLASEKLSFLTVTYTWKSYGWGRRSCAHCPEDTDIDWHWWTGVTDGGRSVWTPKSSHWDSISTLSWEHQGTVGTNMSPLVSCELLLFINKSNKITRWLTCKNWKITTIYTQELSEPGLSYGKHLKCCSECIQLQE